MSDKTTATETPIEELAENVAATATADTASEDWRERMAAEDAAAAPAPEPVDTHAGHDHAGHAGHDHAGHDHSGHDHSGHGHGAGPASVPAGADGPAENAPAPWTGPKAAVDDIEEAMKDVVDPELGINVVDLGLVYGVHVDDANVITLDMTLTSAACPLTDVIEDQTRSALTTGPGGGLTNDFRINWVWLPPWGPDKITDEGRDQLRALGFNV
jgi:metal-sulfur cluster biosynthetic enzyme